MEQDSNNNNDDFSVGVAIPMYDQVKNEIYTCFKQLNNYSSKIICATKNSEVHLNLIHFKRTFTRFFLNVNDNEMLGKLSELDNKKIKYYSKYTKNIKRHNCQAVTDICRKVICNLGLTSIQKIKDNRTTAVKNSDIPNGSN